MRKILGIFTVLMLATMVSWAQRFFVTGKVTSNGSAGNALAGATITVKGTSKAVKATSDGNFRIEANAGDMLVVSYSGFKPQTVAAGPTFMDVALTSNSEQTEVVVVSIGAVRPKAALGYATQTIKAAELTQAAPTNLQNGLTAKVPGLLVATTNSGVAGTTRLTLRGIRSLTGNNQPMLIVNGVPVSLGFIDQINPDDVGEISVLKSSASTALYGPDGANGAIVVTMKKGNKSKPSIKISHSTQFESVSYLPKFQTEFGGGYATDAIGNGIWEPIEQQSWGPRFDGSTRQFGQTGPNGEKLEMPFSNNPNGRRNFYDVGQTNLTNLSFSTGDFYISAQNSDVKGTMPGDTRKRRTLNFRSEKEYNKFKVILSGTYTNDKVNTTAGSANVYYGVTSLPGNYDASRFKNWKTDYFSSPDGYYTPYLDGRGKTPYFAKDNFRNTSKEDNLIASAEFGYKISKNLNAMYRLSTTYANNQFKNTVAAYKIGAFHKTLRDPMSRDIAAAVTDRNISSNRLTNEVFVNYDKSFGKIGLKALLGYTFREGNSKFLSVGTNNGFSELLSIQTRIGEPIVGESGTKTRLERKVAQIGLDYDNWAFLEATGSYDINSVLAPADGKFSMKDIGAFYPGINGSVLLHKVIPGMEDSKTINYLKVRGAINQTANASVGPYTNEVGFNVGQFFPFGATLGYNSSTAFIPRTNVFERINNKEIGFEVGLLKDKIRLEVNAYQQDNDRQSLSANLPISTGYATTLLNDAAFTNKGIEANLNLDKLITFAKDGNISLSINYTYQVNKVTKVLDNIDELSIGNYNWVIKNSPAFVFKVNDYIRDPEGRVIVDNITGMPTVNPNLTQFGKTTPDNILGLNFGVNWRSLRFAVVGEYRGGNQIIADELGQFLDDNGISERSAANGRRAFVFPNSSILVGGKYVANTNIYTQQYGIKFWNTATNTNAITNYMASGSFWKLREASLTYSLPTKMLPKGLQGINFAITGRNLLMFVPKSNVWTDPEFSATTGNIFGDNSFSGNAQGRSTAFNAPPTRIFGASIGVQF